MSSKNSCCAAHFWKQSSCLTWLRSIAVMRSQAFSLVVALQVHKHADQK